jgi:protein-S-isoprenylcysteine O-methyltransferase Ste14
VQESTDTRRAPAAAIVGTIVFTICVPGTVVVLVPYLLCRWRINPQLFGLSIVSWLGVALFLAALPIFATFLIRFVTEGLGTPAPIAPTERLVTGGPFQRVRNPGYIAVLAMIVGQGLFFGDAGVLVYALVVAVAFHLFVILYEEPTLRARYGAEYERYCRQVPRWVPRMRTAKIRQPPI